MISVRPECYTNMSPAEWSASSATMLGDLMQLAHRDGCIAAAWALKVIAEYERQLSAERIEIVTLDDDLDDQPDTDLLPPDVGGEGG